MLIAVTSFEATNSVHNITDKKTSFSISSPSYWISVGGEELINKLKKLLELRSQNDIDLHGKNFKKKRHSNRNWKQWLQFSRF